MGASYAPALKSQPVTYIQSNLTQKFNLLGSINFLDGSAHFPNFEREIQILAPEYSFEARSDYNTDSDFNSVLDVSIGICIGIPIPNTERYRYRYRFTDPIYTVKCGMPTLPYLCPDSLAVDDQIFDFEIDTNRCSVIREEAAIHVPEIIMIAPI